MRFPYRNTVFLWDAPFLTDVCRLTNGRRRPSLRSRTAPLHLSSMPRASAAGPSQTDRRSPSREDALQSRQGGGNSSSGGARRPWSARTAQQLPRPSSGGSKGRAGSPPRLGRHSSSRARPPPPSHMPGLQFTRSTARATADSNSAPRQSAHDQNALIHPSAWNGRQAANPVPPASGAAGPSRDQQALRRAASQHGSLHACALSQAMSPQPVASPVSPYAAVYGAAVQQRQQPFLGSPSPIGGGAPPFAVRPSGGETTGAGVPAADAAAGSISTCHPSGMSVAVEPALGGMRSTNGSDESSASMAAVRDPDAHLPPAQKRRRINDPLQSSITCNGRSHHSRSLLESGHEGSIPAAGSREQHRSRKAHSQPDAAWQDRANAKQAAFAEVKALLSPLLGHGLVDREQYKAAAKAATHLLYRGDGAGAHGAAQALGEVLSGMDLAHAAVAVLQGV